MEFCDDMSYVDKSLVERGLIRAVPYQIRLDRFFTKKEMEENLAYAESHSEDERLRKTGDAGFLGNLVRTVPDAGTDLSCFCRETCRYRCIW